MFEAATFSVAEVKRIETFTACLAGFERWNTTGPSESRVINKIDYRAFETGDAAMMQQLSARRYRTFHNGKCYQLNVAFALANPAVFDPPAREFSKDDWNAVSHALEQARDSFRFLK